MTDDTELHAGMNLIRTGFGETEIIESLHALSLKDDPTVSAYGRMGKSILPIVLEVFEKDANRDVDMDVRPQMDALSWLFGTALHNLVDMTAKPSRTRHASLDILMVMAKCLDKGAAEVLSEHIEDVTGEKPNHALNDLDDLVQNDEVTPDSVAEHICEKVNDIAKSNGWKTSDAVLILVKAVCAVAVGHSRDGREGAVLRNVVSMITDISEQTEEHFRDKYNQTQH